jgi:hypothetical protein
MNPIIRAVFSPRPGIKITDTALRGKVVVEAPADTFFGGRFSGPYRSAVMTDPTWGDLMKCLCEQIACTCDEHHVYLEGFGGRRKDGDVTVIKLSLGS